MASDRLFSAMTLLTEQQDQELISSSKISDRVLMRSLKALLCFFLFIAPLHSQVDPESRTLARELQKKLDFNVEFASLILRVGQQIDDDLKSSSAPQARLEDFLDVEHEKIEEILKKRIMEFADFYEQNITLPAEHKGIFRRYFPLFQWRNVSDLLKTSMVGLEGFFKRKGIGVAIGIGLGLICEYSSYFLLYQLGLPQFLPIAMATPYGTILTGGPLVYNYFRMKKKIKKFLGGSSAFKAYRMQLKESYKKLQMKSPDQILFPLSEFKTNSPETVNALVLSKNTWWDALLTKIGLNPKRLSYPTLKLFTVVHGIDNEAIRWIRNQEGLPYYLKTALISDHILKTAPEDIKAKFITQFGSNMIEVQRAPYWADLKDWTHRLMAARDMKSIRSLMAEIPPGVSPHQIVELWERIILPHYATHFEMSYKGYHRLKEEVTLLKALIIDDGTTNWNSRFYQEFEKRLSRALRVELTTCETPEKNILIYLLNKS